MVRDRADAFQEDAATNEYAATEARRQSDDAEQDVLSLDLRSGLRLGGSTKQAGGSLTGRR